MAITSVTRKTKVVRNPSSTAGNCEPSFLLLNTTCPKTLTTQTGQIVEFPQTFATSMFNSRYLCQKHDSRSSNGNNSTVLLSDLRELTSELSSYGGFLSGN